VARVDPIEEGCRTGLTATQILQEVGEHHYDQPTRRTDDYTHWHRLTWQYNRQYLRPECQCPACQGGH
jgi:hypothetical protein